MRTPALSLHFLTDSLGGSIGAGLFVGSGGALRTGGPASLLLGFAIVGVMLLCTMQALGEMAVLFPVNGAFYTYIVRFVDPSWGFAVGWDYAIGWLTVLPFELTAASITIEFWRDDIHPSVWITVFLVFLIGVQIFGVRGYGEVEFVLSMIKIIACMGFIIFGIITNCGGIFLATTEAILEVATGVIPELSTTSFTASARSSSLLHLPLVGLSSLVLLQLKPQIRRSLFQRQPVRCSGVLRFSISSRSALLVSFFLRTTRVC